MKKFLICYGTRPEYIKVKSLIDNIENVITCFTGQHSNLLEEHTATFNLFFEDDANNNRLNNILINILKNSHIFKNIDYVLVQGDTTSALGIAISAFNNGIKIIHLEAGLRSRDIFNPYPEEFNRRLISNMASIHFCPTLENKNNLLIENIPNKNIYVVGNTVFDNIDKNNCSYDNIIIITLHRRDNLPIIKEWFHKIEEIANVHKEITFYFILHPNPEIQKNIFIFNNVNVIKNVNHKDMINLLKKSKFVISDSGGLQEECSYLNKKIIICRKNTERKEILGFHGVLCPSPSELSNLFNEINNNYVIDHPCPFGDGNAYLKIIEVLKCLD